MQGDAADWTLMVVSTLVLVWLSANMYRVYVYLYYTFGAGQVGMW